MYIVVPQGRCTHKKRTHELLHLFSPVESRSSSATDVQSARATRTAGALTGRRLWPRCSRPRVRTLVRRHGRRTTGYAGAWRPSSRLQVMRHAGQVQQRVAVQRQEAAEQRPRPAREGECLNSMLALIAGGRQAAGVLTIVRPGALRGARGRRA